MIVQGYLKSIRSIWHRVQTKPPTQMTDTKIRKRKSIQAFRAQPVIDEPHQSRTTLEASRNLLVSWTAMMPSWFTEDSAECSLDFCSISRTRSVRWRKHCTPWTQSISNQATESTSCLGRPTPAEDNQMGGQGNGRSCWEGSRRHA